MIKRYLMIWLLISVALSAADSPAPRKSIVINKDTVQRQEAATLPLGDVSYEEVEPICRQMLSPKGTIGYFARRKAMIVYDNPENIAKIKAFLSSVDRPSSNIRLDVTFANSESDARDHIDVRFGNGRRPPIVIDDGKVSLPDRIGIDAGSTRRNTDRNTTQTLVARSGSLATIWAGKQVPDPAWLQHQHFAPVIIVPGYGTSVVLSGADIPWRDVGASLMARPTLRADGLIDVELIPVVSYIEKNGRRRNLKVQQVDTKVTVSPGHAMKIGGIDNATADTLTKFGAHSIIGKTGNTHYLDIQLRATVIQPPRRRK